MRITVRKSRVKNKFWVHYIDINEKVTAPNSSGGPQMQHTTGSRDGAITPARVTQNPAESQDQNARRFSLSDDEWLAGLDIDSIIAEVQAELDNLTPGTKSRAKARVDEVNKRLKKLGLEFTGDKTLSYTDERIDKYMSSSWYSNSNPK